MADTQLRSQSRSLALAAGGSYQVTNTVSIPANAPPSYYLILKTDDQNAVFEANEMNNVLVVSTSPALRISRTDDGVEIRWPAWASAYTLESTLSLNPPISWTPLTNAPVIVGNDQVLTLAPTNVSQFLRLRKQ